MINGRASTELYSCVITAISKPRCPCVLMAAACDEGEDHVCKWDYWSGLLAVSAMK